MKFGIFMSPFHDHSHNPNTGLPQDLKLIQHLDELGFDEAWPRSGAGAADRNTPSRTYMDVV